MVAEATFKNDNLLAWQGLQIVLREEWRPLKVEGTHERGSVTIGDMNGPIFQLRWLRPPKNTDAKAWIKKRRGQVAGGQHSVNPPHPAAFEHVAWIKELEIREEAQKTVWWGAPKNTEVLVEILLTNLCDPQDNDWFLQYALPKLNYVSIKEDCKWQIYSARFTVPAGYILKQTRLVSGDIALEFQRNGRDRLLVRQVYPAGLALQRRSLFGWLRDQAFKEHRRFRRNREEPTKGEGVKWIGWKRLPVPLGWIRPKRSEAMIVKDEDLDRLLIAENDWRQGADTKPVEELISGMRWGAL